MNPSTEDMLNAIEQVNAETVFILPNNKNIILAATQAQSLVEDKNVVIIPTTTVPQGISAIIGFDPEADAEENEDNMKDIIECVKTGEVTYAVRHPSMVLRSRSMISWESMMMGSRKSDRMSRKSR